jgi:hypothetical protein
MLEFIGGRLTAVFYRNEYLNRLVESKPRYAALNRRDIGPQLPLGVLVRASYEAEGSAPQHQRDYRKHPLAGFNAENRDFRSVLAAMLALLFATWIYLRGRTVTGWIIAAYAIFGLILRADLWSLAVRIM